jgi:hypothetical protein
MIFPRSLLTLALLASAFSFALCCLYPSRPLPPQMVDLAVPINLQCTWEREPLRQSNPLRNVSTIRGGLLRRSGLD